MVAMQSRTRALCYSCTIHSLLYIVCLRHIVGNGRDIYEELTPVFHIVNAKRNSMRYRISMWCEY